MPMSHTRPFGAMLAVGVILAALPAHAITVSSIDFTLDQIDFLPGGGIDFDLDALFDDFLVDTQTGGSGDLVSLGGEVTGTFSFDTLGSVSSSGGTFSIDDGGGDILTGALNLQTIEFDEGVSQTVTLNGTLAFLPGYAGGNGDLFSLSTEGALFGLSTDFVYTGLSNLQALFEDGDSGGVFRFAAGNATAVPEPRSLALLGMGLISISVIARRRNSSPSSSQRRSIRLLSHGCGAELAS